MTEARERLAESESQCEDLRNNVMRLEEALRKSEADGRESASKAADAIRELRTRKEALERAVDELKVQLDKDKDRSNELQRKLTESLQREQTLQASEKTMKLEAEDYKKSISSLRDLM